MVGDITCVEKSSKCRLQSIPVSKCHRKRRRCKINKLRLQYLAQPKHIKKSKQVELATNHKSSSRRSVEIVNLCEQGTKTRLEQLSYPLVRRRLNVLKQHPSYISLSADQKESVNRLMRRSLLSLYSRLSNVQLQDKPRIPLTKTPEVDKKKKKEMRMLAKRLPKKKTVKAVDKKREKTVKKKRYTGTNDDHDGTSRRFSQLAQPRMYENPPSFEWALTHNLKNYKPTERVLKLAKPRPNLAPEPKSSDIKMNILHYNASTRIKSLAKPRSFYAKPEKVNFMEVTRNALRAKATERLLDLAKPIERYEQNIRSNAFKISSAALRAKASERIKSLAQPRTYKP